MLELNNTLIRKKTDQQNKYRDKLNIPKAKEFKHTITVAKLNAKNNKKIIYKKKSNLNVLRYLKDFPISLNEPRNPSIKLLRAKTQKYNDKPKIKKEDIFDIKKNIAGSASSTKLNKIGMSIIRKINNMKLEIEKNSKKLNTSNLMNNFPDKSNTLKVNISFSKKEKLKKRKIPRQSALIYYL